MGTLINEQTMTQCDMILDYMRENGSITQAEATDEIGCVRLPARIWDLKQRGYHIKKIMRSKKNRWGKAISFAAYELESEETA